MLPLSTSNAPRICHPYLMAKHWERQKTQITPSAVKPLPLRILRVYVYGWIRVIGSANFY